MKLNGAKTKDIIWLLAVVVACVWITGCSSPYGNKKDSSFRSKFLATRNVKKAPPAKYIDFNDVLVPRELEKDSGNSFIYSTQGFAAGVLALKGRVEVNSLINFFDNNMAKDNWKQLSSFRSPRTMMLFQKENRWCVISVIEEQFGNTYVEIWVAPTLTHVNEGTVKSMESIQERPIFNYSD